MRVEKQLLHTLEAGESAVLVLRPNWESIEAKFDEIIREKLIEEHITLYNRTDPEEHRWIPMRIAFQHVDTFEHTDKDVDLPDFHASSGPTRSYPFQVMEESVVQFIREYNALPWDPETVFVCVGCVQLKHEQTNKMGII